MVRVRMQSRTSCYGTVGTNDHMSSPGVFYSLKRFSQFIVRTAAVVPAAAVAGIVSDGAAA